MKSTYEVRGINGAITITVSEDFSDIDTGDAGLQAYVRGYTDSEIDAYFHMCSEDERSDIKAIARAYDQLGGYIAYHSFFPSIVGRRGEGLKEITEADPLWEADRAYKAAERAKCDALD